MAKSMKEILDKITKDQQEKGERRIAEIEADPTPLSDEEREQGHRLIWAIKVAYAHANKMMPWRADAPTNEDAAWVNKVCQAVSDKAVRPPHPDAEIEEVLEQMFP